MQYIGCQPPFNPKEEEEEEDKEEKENDQEKAHA
jgi:hypothetical protein